MLINEVLADPANDLEEKEFEWVELYNDGDDSVDVSGYVIRDESGKELIVSLKHLDASSAQVHGKSFIKVTRRGASLTLNNDADTLYLFESTTSAEPLDTVSYSKTSTDLSWGRIPDGQGNLVADLPPTPGTANQSPPTPEPTSSPTPKPTATPKSATPVPTAKPTSKPSSSVQSSQTPWPEFDSDLNEPEILGIDMPNDSQASHAAVLGTTSAPRLEDPPEATPSPYQDIHEAQAPRHAFFFVLSGVLFLAAAGVRWFKKRIDASEFDLEPT